MESHSATLIIVIRFKVCVFAFSGERRGYFWIFTIHSILMNFNLIYSFLCNIYRLMYHNSKNLSFFFCFELSKNKYRIYIIIHIYFISVSHIFTQFLLFMLLQNPITFYFLVFSIVLHKFLLF